MSTMGDRRSRLQTLRGLQFGLQKVPMAASHSHPGAASQRAQASKFLTDVAAKLGQRRYDISISSRELSGHIAGSRQYRAVKDLLSDSVHDVRLQGDFVTMIDTDYYLSEKDLAAYAGHDMGFYALQPDGLSGGSSECAWRFTDPTTVVEMVAGGAAYTHSVWDWGKDLVVLRRAWHTYIYDVVQYHVAPGRSIVVLALARTVWGPGWLVDWLVPGLQQCAPSRYHVADHGDYLLGVFGSIAGRAMHIMPKGDVGLTHYSVPLPTWNALAHASRIPTTERKVAGNELLPSAVERITRDSGSKIDKNGCLVISGYFSTSYKAYNLVNYQASTGLSLEDGKCGASLAAVPLVGAGCAPTSSENNERRAIEKRIVAVANKNVFSSNLVDYAAEFAALVVPVVGMGVPLSLGELAKQQSSPAQIKRRLAESQFTSDERASMQTSSFQKKETYPKPGDPRLINQVATDHTNRLCAYSSAIKPHMKERNGKWYAVGKTPMQIATAIRGLQKVASAQLVGGDYSRMDGRTSVAYRTNVLEPVYKRFFAREYHDEITQLLDREKTATTTTRGFGIKAKLGGANISGSGITTDLNTLDAAFNEYAARRRLGQKPKAAYDQLGLYFGDDSLVSPDVFDAVEAVAEETGMVLTRETVPEAASPGYAVFLSRVYPDIRTSLASHPCMVRSLRKMCTVMVGPDSPDKIVRMKLNLKAKAALATDAHVPVLAAYARALGRIYPVKASETHWADMIGGERSYQRKLAEGPYPSTTDDAELLTQSVAWDLGIGEEEVMLLERRLNGAKSEADLAALVLAGHEADLPEWAHWVPTASRDT